MPQFKYVGDPNDKFAGPEVINIYGQAFKKGETVDVPDRTREEKSNVLKLKGHSHFVDPSDSEKSAEVAEKQKALEKAVADKAKQAEDQRKRDEADAKELNDRRTRVAGEAPVISNAPRPPGTVTKEPAGAPFDGRTVEYRSQAEDHTKAGKTK